MATTTYESGSDILTDIIIPLQNMAISKELVESRTTLSHQGTANTLTEEMSARNVSTPQTKFQKTSTGEKSILTSSTQSKVVDVPRKHQQNRMREKSIFTPKETVVTATQIQNALHKNKSGEKSILDSTKLPTPIIPDASNKPKNTHETSKKVAQKNVAKLNDKKKDSVSTRTESKSNNNGS
jgi:ethanolamine utilization protein EutA (predicted chaperonin)